jgi:hypothetical protein
MEIADKAELKNAFWTAVTRCLEEFHAYGAPRASAEVRGLQQRITKIHVEDQGSLADLVFHAEPWHLAADIAGDEKKTLSLAHARRYREILKETGLLAEESVAKNRTGRAAR